jgi:hypothetical protein
MRQVRSYPVVVEMGDGSKVEGRCFSGLARYCPSRRLDVIERMIPRYNALVENPLPDDATPEMIHEKNVESREMVYAILSGLLDGVTIEQLTDNWTADEVFELFAKSVYGEKDGAEQPDPTVKPGENTSSPNSVGAA